ncbi:MAG: TetR/AcrR family transcriptional regulator [Bacteroidota bacterium]|jgi:AcrR family transcriptional regulator
MAETLTINRKEQIMQVAARLFNNKGYEATSMRDIASDLGMEAASLYHHIKSKEEILTAICFEMADRFITALKEVNDIYFNAEERLRMAIQFHVQISCDNLDKTAVFLSEWRSLPEPHRSEFRKLRDNYEKQFRIIVKDGETEDIFDDVDEKFAALTILSSVNWIHQWYKPDGSMNPSQIAKKLADIIIGGIRKKMITDPHYKPE